MNIGVYATWEEIKDYCGILPGDVVDDATLKRFSVAASRLFDSLTYRKFYPVQETRYYDHPGGDVVGDEPLDSLTVSIQEAGPDTAVLWLYDDLLEIVTLTTKNGTITISAGDYLLLGGNRYGRTPYNKIRLQPNGTTTQFDYVNTPYKANVVTGLWGFHDDWANAWLDSGSTVQDNPLSASGQAVAISAASGYDVFGITTQFRSQQLIRFGSAAGGEYAGVVAASPTSLTVVRGVNGSTAAAQAQGTKIYIYQPMGDVNHVLKLWGDYLFKLRQSPFGIGGTQELGQREIASLLGSDMTKLALRWKDQTRSRD